MQKIIPGPVLRLALLDGRSRVLELPTQDDAANAKRFREAAAAIREEWRLRRPDRLERATHRPVSGKRPLLKSLRAEAPGRKKAADHNSWLRKACYELIGGCLDEDLASLLGKFPKKPSKRPSTAEGWPNPFSKGVTKIFADDSAMLSRQERLKVSRQLWHAYRHYVPPALLEGFLLQCKSLGIETRAYNGKIEPGFEEWIVEGMVRSYDPEIRGPYPNNIEFAFSQRD